MPRFVFSGEGGDVSCFAKTLRRQSEGQRRGNKWQRGARFEERGNAGRIWRRERLRINERQKEINLGKKGSKQRLWSGEGGERREEWEEAVLVWMEGTASVVAQRH